jgi:lipopolysaccharide/colanic/teichoic acid biosynthesis glycosyltransferase
MDVYRNYGKRCLDAIVAGLALIVLSPVLLAVAIVVRGFIGRPVLFRQCRAGLHGRPFRIVKFRTMRDTHDGAGKLLPDEHRLTRVGRFLRATSLDELPELWNVLRGDMSLVGPRPLLMDYLELYSPRQHRRHEVRPAITGLSQVRGRNAIEWSARLEMDVLYVDHLSFFRDMKILIETLKCVLSCRGVHAVGHVTMPRFEGNSLPSKTFDAA